MAIGKDDFAKYANERRNPNLSKALDKKKYTHNRVFDKLDSNNSDSSVDNTIRSINPDNIENWKYHDRLEQSLGDIDGLANEFKTVGQQQPCIVRPALEDNKYELIIGERRWRAAKKAGINLLVIVKNIDDNTAALAQAAENDNRENLSDYEKGLSLGKLIENKVIKQKDLIEKLGRSKQYVSALLSFSKIPDDIKLAIGDMSKLSAIAAERIKQISNRSEEHRSALLTIGHKFNGKTLGVNAIEKEVLQELEKNETASPQLKAKKLRTNDGRHVATWRTNNNGMLSLHLPKEINDLIDSNKINIDQFGNKIIEVLENELSNLK